MRDSLHLFNNCIGCIESPDVNAMLLQSCCCGMGIGTSRRLDYALKFCVAAGLKGDNAAKVTAISLYVQLEALRAHEPCPLNDDPNIPSTKDIEWIEHWRSGKDLNGIIPTPNVGGPIEWESECRLRLPYIFEATPAARGFIRTSPSTWHKIYPVTCDCQNSRDEHISSSNICGLQLLEQLDIALHNGSYGMMHDHKLA